MDSKEMPTSVPDLDTFLSPDYDISSIPPQWKKVLRDAGVKKKDLRDIETRRMIYELLKNHEDEVKAVNSPNFIQPDLAKIRSLSGKGLSQSEDIDLSDELDFEDKEKFFSVRDKKKKRTLLTRSRSIDEISRINMSESPPGKDEPGRSISRPSSPSVLSEKKKGSLRKMFGSKKGSFFSMSASKLGFLPEKKSDDRIADHLNSLQSDSLMATIASEIARQDTWSSKPRVVYKWDTEVDPGVANTFSNDCTAAGYHFEYGNRRAVVDPDTYFIEDSDNDIPYYRNYFQGRLQLTLLYDGVDDSLVGPVCISVEDTVTEDKKAYMRTKKGNTRFMIPSQHSSTKDILKYIKTTYTELANVKFTEVYNDNDLVNKLIEYENQGIISRYKFGVLYVKDGQTDEDDMFSNTETSQDYEDFLSIIGDRVELQGWGHYRGGLDVKTNTTGTYSVYTKFRDQFEIMFHVSTLLPFQPDDKQRVERKRHLGNDIIMLIFKEGNKPFDPLCIKSHFNHIFAVVQVNEKHNGRATSYKLSIANRTAVLPYGPWIPSPPVFSREEFREFLLTKLVNAERAAMHSPDFKGKMLRTAKEMLTDIAKEFSPKGKKKKHSISLTISPEILGKSIGSGSSPESPLSIYTPTARSSPDRSSFSRGALSAPVAPNLAPFVAPKQEEPLTFQMEPVVAPSPVTESLLHKSTSLERIELRDSPVFDQKEKSPSPVPLTHSPSKERVTKVPAKYPDTSVPALKKSDIIKEQHSGPVRKSSDVGSPRTMPSWQTATYDAIKDNARANRNQRHKTIDVAAFHAASPSGKNTQKLTPKKSPTSASFSTDGSKELMQAIANSSIIGNRSLNSPTKQIETKPFTVQVEEEIPNVTVLMSYQEKEEYLKIFDRADDDKDGLITGAQAASLLISSGLPKDELTKIWVLSDINSDRHFDREEFAIAQYLIAQRKKGSAIPEKLPKKLLPMKRQWRFTPQEKEDITNKYKQLEKGDTVSAADFSESHNGGTLTAQEVAKIFVLADITQDGALSYDEYIIASLLADHMKSGDSLGSYLPYALVHVVRTMLATPVLQEVVPVPVEHSGVYQGPLTAVLQIVAKDGKEIQVKDFIKGNLSNRQMGQHLRIYRDIDNNKLFSIQLNFDSDMQFKEWKDYTFNAIDKVQSYLLAEAPVYKKLEKL